MRAGKQDIPRQRQIENLKKLPDARLKCIWQNPAGLPKETVAMGT